MSKFIEWLGTQDPDAVVQIIVVQPDRQGNPCTTDIVPFDPSLSWARDFTGVSDPNHPFKGEKLLLLGED